MINDNNLSYVLELVSPEQLLNQQRKVCGSFKNKSPTNVAKAILTNKKYGLNLDSRRVDITAGVGTDTVPIKDFIIPNWSPFKALNWLAQKSLSTAGGMDVTVFFYESFSPKPNETHIRSKFNFKSFAEMFRDKSEEIYTYYPTEDSSDRRGMSQKEIDIPNEFKKAVNLQ